MPKLYSYTSENIDELELAYKQSRNAKIAHRIQIVLLRARGFKMNQVTSITHAGSTTVSRLTRTYFRDGISALLDTNYKPNHRYMSFDEETTFLKRFEDLADKGQIITIKAMHVAYQEEVGRSSSRRAFYTLLKRHEWRKVMPRPHHPKQAGASEQEARKKLTL
jgi:transposase